MSLAERFEHSVDALLLLFEVGMDVEVQGCADVCMTEDDTDGLVIAVALDTTCGKTVAQAVELDDRNAELF